MRIIAAVSGGMIGLTLAVFKLQAEPQIDISEKIARLAKIMRSVTPRKLSDTMSLDDVAAERDALVLKISGLPKWRPNVSDADAGLLLGEGICDGPQMQALVREGAKVRIDGKTVDGELLPPLPICIGKPQR